MREPCECDSWPPVTGGRQAPPRLRASRLFLSMAAAGLDDPAAFPRARVTLEPGGVRSDYTGAVLRSVCTAGGAVQVWRVTGRCGRWPWHDCWHLQWPDLGSGDGA